MTNNIATKTYQRSEDLLGAAVDDELLMMSIEKGCYFSLNSVGARIWELLKTPVTLAQLTSSLTTEYDVPAQTCEQEIARFLAALDERGMLVHP